MENVLKAYMTAGRFKVWLCFRITGDGSGRLVSLGVSIIPSTAGQPPPWQDTPSQRAQSCLSAHTERVSSVAPAIVSQDMLRLAPLGQRSVSNQLLCLGPGSAL